jgi:hypothetical protein
MARWKHELKIKDLFLHLEGDQDENAKKVAPEVSARVAALSKRLTSKDPMLSSDLEEIADSFSVVHEDDEPSEMFNGVLSDLYDLGDRHRIWIG